jgi:hypothetical protein
MITKLRSVAFGLLLVGAAAVPAAAMAANDYSSTPPNSVATPPAVQPVVVVQPAHDSAPVAVVAVSPVVPVTNGGSLPFTGGDVAGLVVIGVVLLGTGSILVRRSRSGSASR